MARVDSVNMAGERTDFFPLAGPVECQRDGDGRGLALRRKLTGTVAYATLGQCANISLDLKVLSILAASRGETSAALA